MTTVTVPRISGSVDVDSFTDITPVCVTDVSWVEDGLAVTFDGDLDDDVVQLVKIRCVAPDATAETLLRQAWTARKTNSDYLALPTPTNAQIAAQVAATTKQIQGIIRLLAPVEAPETPTTLKGGDG